MPRTANPLIVSLLNLRGNGRACVYTEPMWGLSMMLVLPYASVFMLTLGVHDEQIGLIASVSMVSQVVFGLLSGVLTDKLGRRLTTAVFDIVAWAIPCLLPNSPRWAVPTFSTAATVGGTSETSQRSWPGARAPISLTR